MFSGLRFLIYDITNFTILKRCDVLIFADPFNRRVKVQNKKYEIYVDPIYDELIKLKKNSFIIERNTTGEYQRPRYSKSFPQFLIQILFSPIMLKSVTLPNDLQQLLLKIEKELTSSGYATQTLNASSVKKIIKIFKLHIKIYSFIYAICNPKFVVLTEWYSIISCACIVAAKKRNIMTIEVQHGVQTDTHIAYGNWYKNPSEHRNPFPDLFWVWSEADKLNIEKTFSIFSSTAFLGGNLFLNNFLKSKVSLYGENEMEPLLKTGKKICLITMQPNYDLHNSILEYIDLIKNEYIFLFRKHPLMTKSNSYYIEQIKTRFPDLIFDLEISSKIPLFILLKHSTLHLTYNSSTVLEAENFGVPSVIFDTDIATTLYDKQITSGICKLYQKEVIHFNQNFTSKKNQEFQDIKMIFKDIIK